MSMVLTKNIDEFGEDDGDAVHALGSPLDMSRASVTVGSVAKNQLSGICPSNVFVVGIPYHDMR